MKFVLLSLALFLACVGVPSAEAKEKKGKIRHVVAFKFKAEAAPKDIAKVEEAFAALKEKIPQISSFEWGTNISPEKLDKGFTHCFVVSFKNEKDRDAYLIHPEHKAFVDIVKPLVADAFVVDYQPKK